MNRIDMVDIDLNSGKIFRSFADHTIGEGDNLGDQFGVNVFQDGEPVTLSNAACVAYFIRNNGDTVALTGVISGNQAYVILPQACYAYEGQFALAIKIAHGTANTTVRIVDGTVCRTITSTPIDPGSTIPDLTDLLAQISAMEAATAAANAAASKIAPTFDAGTAYSAGQYVFYNNNLYQFTADHAAGAWTGTDCTSVTVGGELADLNTAITMLGGGGVLLPVDSSPTYRRAIYSDGTWGVATGGNQTESVIMPIPIGAKKITVVCASNETIIAFLKTFTGSEADGSSVDFASHYTSRQSIASNTTASYVLYGDEKYIFVFKKASGGASMMPQSVTAYSDVLIGTDKTLSVSGMAADAETVGTIADGTMFPQMGNIVPLYTDYRQGKYGYSNSIGQGITYGSNSDYDAIIVPVDESTEYSCNTLRYVTLLDSVYHAQAVSSENATGFTTLSGTKYICATFNNSDYTISTLVISPGEKVDPSPVSHSIPWLYQPYGAITERIEKDFYRQYPFGEQYKGNDQSKVLGTANSIKKGKIVNFSCDFSSFDTLHIKLQTAGGTVENDFAISSTNVVRTVDGSTRAPVAHGLTIQNTIGVRIEFTPSGFIFTIISNGETFEQTYEYASAAVAPKYEVSGMTISNVDFSWTCKNFADGIWLFGDSYFSYGTNRWIYYLVENGYADHCLIDGYPGEDSPHALASLKSYISMSTPKYAVWCLGMNDGSDNGAPTTQWLKNVQEFLAVCSDNHITPILATIPTVPTINHDYKNAWIRASDYQYIDFAKAVGASSDGWFDGMLASDGVHPTVAGAMALYHRAMTDAPQLYNVI